MPSKNWFVVSLKNIRIYKIFVLILNASSGAHSVSHSMGTGRSFPANETYGAYVDHSPPSSAKVKNTWSHIYHVCPHVLERDNFTLPLHMTDPVRENTAEKLKIITTVQHKKS